MARFLVSRANNDTKAWIPGDDAYDYSMFVAQKGSRH
jgi:hypothetical protein